LNTVDTSRYAGARQEIGGKALSEGEGGLEIPEGRIGPEDTPIGVVPGRIGKPFTEFAEFVVYVPL
jgi:hypothetical protein